jgi:hypothetical protein
MLLRRQRLPVPEVVERLVGMQAQVPGDPYVALWARLERFEPVDLSRLISEREAVRLPLLRTTLHLVTARDCLSMRPLIQPVLERGFRTGSPFWRQLTGVDLDALLAAGREIVEERPRSTAALAKLLHERWPDRDPASLSYAVRYLVPVVQVPPRGLWGGRGQATWTTVEAWLGRPLSADGSLDDLLLRYLAAFGPASVTDVRTWSWLTDVREVVERLRPRLRVFRDERGRELFDLPDAPRPDPDTPAPVRFLPQYDNLLLSHDDRSRVILDEHRRRLLVDTNATFGSVLVDGFVAATWKTVPDGATKSLRIHSLEPLTKADATAVSDEAARLLDFLHPGAANVELREIDEEVQRA